MNRTVISEEKQVHLAEEAKRITKEYELLLEEHLGTEKHSRSKRFKAETQLQNWIIKYDQDIGERQAEYETFKAKFVRTVLPLNIIISVSICTQSNKRIIFFRYDEEKAEMEALQDLFDDQEDEYVFLMKEKAEEEERIYNEMAFHLLQSRCARIIQRAWRAYVQRKKARRKGKKGTSTLKFDFDSVSEQFPCFQERGKVVRNPLSKESFQLIRKTIPFRERR